MFFIYYITDITIFKATLATLYLLKLQQKLKLCKQNRDIHQQNTGHYNLVHCEGTN